MEPADRQLWLPVVGTESPVAADSRSSTICTGSQKELSKQQWRHDCQQEQFKVGHQGWFGEVNRRLGAQSLLGSNVPVAAAASAGQHRYQLWIPHLLAPRASATTVITDGSYISMCAHTHKHTLRLHTYRSCSTQAEVQHTKGSAASRQEAGRWNHLHLHSESHDKLSSTCGILVQKMTRRRSRVTAAENDHRVINKNKLFVDCIAPSRTQAEVQHTKGSAASRQEAGRWNHLHLHSESHDKLSSTCGILVQKMTRRRSRVTAAENDHRVINKNKLFVDCIAPSRFDVWKIAKFRRSLPKSELVCLGQWR
ncbi:hypothetical protein quinque_002254 [Culex quinquefasciatus]